MVMRILMMVLRMLVTMSSPNVTKGWGLQEGGYVHHGGLSGALLTAEIDTKLRESDKIGIKLVSISFLERKG